MRPNKKTIDNMIRRGKKAWGLDDWEITWVWGKPTMVAEIDVVWTEKRGRITIDKEYVANNSRRDVQRVVYHELCHAVIYPIYRSTTDFLDHFVGKIGTKPRDACEDAINSAENITIDHLIVRVLGL